MDAVIVSPGTNPWAVAKVTSRVGIAEYVIPVFPLAICDVVASLIVIALIKSSVGAVIAVPATDAV